MAREKKLYSYVLRYDDGAAPNPFWGTCTLTICKPDIRRTAEVGDWIIGTGSKNTRLKDGFTYDLSDSVVYAMKITTKLTLAEYDVHCRKHLPNKIPSWNNKDFRLRMGDCIIDHTNIDIASSRISVHNNTDIKKHDREELLKRDLRGKHSLLSKQFYYFGEEPRALPQELKYIIKKGQKHKVFTDIETIKKFEDWISQYIQNKIYAEPQLKCDFELSCTKQHIAKCAIRHLED